MAKLGFLGAFTSVLRATEDINLSLPALVFARQMLLLWSPPETVVGFFFFVNKLKQQPDLRPPQVPV